ncbi:alpha/beta fold hydrolase [Leucobacter soli]|uniref:AB hydrolase-1 domain-containing protein n=1 Tax=Leucobacter soli TaxID=2812850 RepID=A0A916JSU1_9MICO|nr:alpha/beta fold hydrolase [Leucobacter soli]CAG7600318.1 hypothetical protein LEUCIP111803_00376 [Leucobacter soli]
MSESLPWPFYTEPSKVDVRGLDVAYRRKGEGEPVLYLHGAGLTQRWLPFHEKMSERVDLLAPEHPGFGDTEMPEWLDGFDDVVLHYADLLDTLGIDRVHVVGHSFGGWIAAEFAVFFPERIKSLQLIAPAGLKGADLNDPFRQEGFEAFERVFNGRGEEFPDYIEEGDPVEALVQGYKETTARARLAWQPRHDRKLPRRLGRVTAPTQVLLAQEDRVMDVNVSAQYADYIEGATVSVVESDGIPTSHVPFVQAPEVLATTITNFVAEHSEA